ncbi:MAG TPA: hypothetical protein VGA26_04040, partial [Candidatus Limnocylindria bacterium]
MRPRPVGGPIGGWSATGRRTVWAMPEGDTIRRTGDVLRAALIDRRITDARARPQPGMRHVPDQHARWGAHHDRQPGARAGPVGLRTGAPALSAMRSPDTPRSP